MSLAKILLSGIVLNAPEKRYTPNGNAVVTFDVSVSAPARGSFAPEAPFTVKITCWNRLADAAAESLAPQQTVLVEGKLQMDAVQGSDGAPKKNFAIEASALSVVHGAIEALAPASSSDASSAASSSRPRPATAPAAAPAPQASRAPAPAIAGAASHHPASSASSGSAFPLEDAFSEDDIPF
ncbi:MAG: single-stranded DNA-binding protein [Vampirovibrionales bacterium]|nr:single-stranded DNA-binding protein [Vampirovibrionales bacterium]